MHGFPDMSEKGRDVEAYANFYDFKCKKHPDPSSVGVCAYCLKERLMKLVCSECEQRLSLCSCSDNSSLYRNSCSTMEIGSVGRISFLLENQKIHEFQQHSVLSFLQRSNSNCAEIKKKNGFWKIKRLFRKKKHKGSVKNGEFCDGIWARNSGFGDVLDAENGGIDPNRRVFAVEGSDFSAMDESEFIDLKLDLLSESKQDLSDYGHCIGYKRESFDNGGSCRMTLNERGSRSGRRSHKVWKWTF